MIITIKIDDCTPKTHTLVEFLKSYAKDTEFMQVYEENTDFSSEIEYEIQQRFESIVAEPDKGKSWEEVKNDLLSK